METVRTKTPAVLRFLLLAAAAFYVVFILRTAFRIHGETFFTLIDDAMVSMRYAHHLAQGHGLVWNVGEQPVEGFTNPAWVLLMAFLHWLPAPASKLSGLVMLVAAAILLANAFVVYRICEEFTPSHSFAPLMAAAITAFYFPLVFWSLRGMEVGLLALLADTGALLALRITHYGPRRLVVLLAVVCALALAVRLDAVLAVGIIMVYVLSTRTLSLRFRGLPVLTSLLTVICILWFQRVYFGDFLPNTYYQKVVGASAAERIKNGLLVFNQYATTDTLLPAVVGIAAVLLYREMRSRETTLLAGLFLAQCVYSVWVGGDYAEPEVGAANRFISQGMPALFILFSLAADRLVSDVLLRRAPAQQSKAGFRAGVSLSIACAALLVISGRPWVTWAIDNAPLLKADVRRVQIGLSIAENTSPAVTIAVHAAGQIPYYSDRRTIDLLGLNDPVVAKGPVTGPFYPGHDKWNYAYSIVQLRPDLIADNWIRLGDFMRGQSEYEQLSNGMYVRKDSTLVNLAGLLRQ